MASCEAGLFSLKRSANAMDTGEKGEKMKSFAQVLCFSGGLLASGSAIAQFDHQLFDQILKQSVVWLEPNSTSCVNYGQIDDGALDRYNQSLSAISQAEFDAWPKPEQLAFLINAYNAFTLELILTRYPDLDSIKELGTLFQSPWKKKRFALFGEPVHLDHIEHELIRPMYQNPHIHAAVVCAAKGCPPLQDFAYQGDQLEAQLQTVFENFLASDKNLYVDYAKRMELSAIFRWYRQDFGASLNQYLSDYSASFDATPEQISEANIRYLDYDWALNRCPG